MKTLSELVTLAASVHRSGALSDGAVRAAFLQTIATEIEALGDDLLEAAHQETHLPLPRLTMERGRTCGQLRRFAQLASDPALWAPVEDVPAPDTGKPSLRRILVPLGPVGVFGASNFPLAFSVAGGDTASALAAGCPVVLKAHPAHPKTCDLVFGAIDRARSQVGLPEGTASLIHGGPEVGQELARHPELAAIGFTGSFAGGTALWRTANERARPIPVFAEMGSVNPVVALPGAQTLEWATAYAASLTLGVGQFCTNPGLLIGWGPSFDVFVSQVAGALDGMAPAPMLTPSILQAYEAGVSHRRGLGKEVTAPRPGSAPSLFRVDSKGFRADVHWVEELFGPSGVAIACASCEDALDLLSHLPGQLTGTVLVGEGDDESLVVHALGQIAGRVIRNGMPTGVEVSPAMQHGGPWPATTDSRFTSVGDSAIHRWLRPVCLQGFG